MSYSSPIKISAPILWNIYHDLKRDLITERLSKIGGPMQKFLTVQCNTYSVFIRPFFLNLDNRSFPAWNPQDWFFNMVQFFAGGEYTIEVPALTDLKKQCVCVGGGGWHELGLKKGTSFSVGPVNPQCYLGESRNQNFSSAKMIHVPKLEFSRTYKSCGPQTRYIIAFNSWNVLVFDISSKFAKLTKRCSDPSCITIKMKKLTFCG